MTTDQQVRRLMLLIKKGLPLSTAAVKAGMSEPTAVSGAVSKGAAAHVAASIPGVAGALGSAVGGLLRAGASSERAVSVGLHGHGGAFCAHCRRAVCAPVLTLHTYLLELGGGVVVCLGELRGALGGLQGALWRLGAVPLEHRTDNLSAATHELRTSWGRG
jgi:hypothetical protein